MLKVLRIDVFSSKPEDLCVEGYYANREQKNIMNAESQTAKDLTLSVYLPSSKHQHAALSLENIMEVELASLLIWKHNVTAWETNRRYE
jgi:hypothetical protein